MERILCVGAHCDDESFGALGTLLKHKEDGAMFAFLAFTQAREADKGFAEMAKYFNAEKIVFLNYVDQALETYKFSGDILARIEEMVKEFKPTIVYCPFIGDLNRDHRIVSEAVMVACRPYKENAPQVKMYQIPGTTELGFREFVHDDIVEFEAKSKEELIKKWYGNELTNGREFIESWEAFERWPSD